MFKLISSQKGSIGIAIVISIIGILSGATLSSIAFRDLHSTRLQVDALQQFHILRSEVGRGRLVSSIFEGMDNPPPESILPIRNINVNFGSHRTRYTARTKINHHSAFAEDGFIIRSLISAVRGTGQQLTDYTRSPVKRYGENLIRSLQTLAIFHYFSDIDRALDDEDGGIRFYGQDIVNGRVHSNTNIWIRQAGGGPNNGWPTFYGLVTTSGEIKVHPGGGGTYPEEDIFLGGLIEGYPQVVFDPDAELIRRNGIRPFGSTEYDNRIAFVTVTGSAFESWIGHIQTGPQEEFTIYDSYPPYGPVGNPIGTSFIAEIDTIWTPGPSGQVQDRSVFVPYELWISGNFGGRQTWGTAGDLYLKDDITYTSTVPGHPPDGGTEGDYPVNNTDYLGLLSEKSIYIQYGYKDPVEETRHRPNTNSINIYAALCAMGEDPGANIHGLHVGAGIFTFQYQFPKGSTPDQLWQGEWWENIDLHLRHYPTSSFQPWPIGLDYPWYNPLWPEPGLIFDVGPPYGNFTPNPHGAPEIIYLRGNINLYGSVAQRRRGFVRRSGNEDNDTGVWDIENGMYGRHTGGIRPIGYDKNYYFDTRFESIGPPDFPLVKFQGYESDVLMDLGYETISWIFKNPRENF